MLPAVLIIIVVLLLLVFELLLQFLVIRVALPIFDGGAPLQAERFPADPSAESLTIATSSGLRLAGSLFRTLQGEPRGLILFCHEFNSDRWSALSYCEGLLAAGFHILAFDFRNHGDSDHMPGYRPNCWLTHFEVDDVLAAVDCVAGRLDLEYLPLGVFGVSRGGAAALMAAARDPRIRRVATDSVYSCDEMLLHFMTRWESLYFPEWGLKQFPRWHWRLTFLMIRAVSQLRRGCRYANIEAALTRLRDTPLFMLSGKRDTYVGPPITANLYSRSGQNAYPVWIVPDAKHNQSRPTAPDEYDCRLLEFFSGIESIDGRPQPAAADVPTSLAPIATREPAVPASSPA